MLGYIIVAVITWLILKDGVSGGGGDSIFPLK